MSMFVPGGPARFKHQREGLRNIIRTRGVHALLFDPGTGKTATTLDYASLLALKATSGEARVLVIAPLAAVDTWVSEPQQFVADGISVWAEAIGGSIVQRAETLALRGGNPLPRSKTSRRSGRGPRADGYRRAYALTLRPAPGASCDPQDGPDGLGSSLPRLIVCAINTDSFASRAAVKGTSKTTVDLMIEAVRRFRPDLIVLDESHRVKGAQSNTSRAIGRLTPLCPRRIILTGTVMPHSPMDVFGQWRFLQPYAFGSKTADGTRRAASFGNFRARFARMGGWMGKEVLGFRNLDEMQAIMAENSTVAKKTEVLDLPPVSEVLISVDLTPAEKKAYEGMKRDLAVQFGPGSVATVPNRLAQLMRLRQITSGYLPDDAGVLNVIGQSKANVIKSLVQDTLTSEPRVVIFCHFKHEIEHLSEILKEKGTEVVTISGDTHAMERERIRSRFGSSDPARIILIAQIKTMSLAVNELVTASHAIFGSLSQQRDDFSQAVARLDRQGQTRPVTVWVTLARGTVDEVIFNSIVDRTNIENAMLAHVMENFNDS